MTFDEYQTKSRKTAGYPAIGHPVIYPTLGLVNEAGEVAGKIKKVFRDKEGEIGDETRQALKAELGDVLWYVAQVCTELGLSLDEVAGYNIEKLYSRLERGTLRGDGDNR
jgi:NTP pyrophosphatase (non-canonical NTP hydrolase)